MKQNRNPVTLFSVKEGARIENTLFKAKWGVVPVNLAALLKRNSQVFYKLGVLKNFAKFSDLKPATALNMTPVQVFSCELVEILITPNTPGLKSNEENTYVGALFQ